MQLYVAQYGLTELRFYTTVFMGWLALILLLLAAILTLGPTRLSPIERPTESESGERPAPDAGKPRRKWTNPFSGPLYRRHFAFAALALGLAIWLGTNLANPDAVIARANLARAAAQPEVAKPCLPGARDGGSERPAGPGCLDVHYLVRLSADAVPTLITGLDGIPDPCSRARLADGLKAEAASLETQFPLRSWRTYTWGELHGRDALAAADAALTRFAAACPSP